MSEEYSDEFVIEEEEPANRSFLILAGSLIGVFIILAACLLAYVLMQRNQQNEAVAQIEAQNATTEAQNAMVTQTVAALQTQAAMPTDTPTPRPTEPPTNTPVPSPTATQVVQQPEAAPPTNTPLPSPTQELVPGGGGTITPVAPGGGETLPQTGVSVWGIAAAGLGLIAVLFVARRLRAN